MKDRSEPHENWTKAKARKPDRDELDIGVQGNTTVQSCTTFEELLDLVGPLGRWQACIFVWIAFLQFWTAMINLAVVFFQITPEHACVLANKTDLWTFQQRMNISSPYDNESKAIESCQYYPNVSQLTQMDFETAFQTAEMGSYRLSSQNCRKWDYDTTVDMRSTIVTDWNLVCDRKFYTEHSQLVYMGGFFFGSLVAGFLSDYFGRKKVLSIAAVFTAGLSLVESFSPTYPVFLVIRFLCAVAGTATWMSCYCLGLEITTSKYRILVGGLFWIPYAFGYTALALVAYITKDWRTMHIVISIPVFVSAVFWWVLPESPRWLIINDKHELAEKTLRKAAKRNRREISEGISFQKTFDCIVEAHQLENKKKLSFVEVFKSKTLAIRAINIYFNWFVNSMVYYGVSLNVSSFAGNRFVNNAIAGAVEIPGSAICVPLLWWGRKKGLFTMLLVAGVTLLPIPWLPKDPAWVALLFAMVGKLAITASFTLVYLFTVELYPTVVRNTGLATSSCVARIGSMLAPYIAGLTKLGPEWHFAPMIVFSAFSLAAAFLTLFLPETLGKLMPEYIEDAKKLGKSKRTVYVVGIGESPSIPEASRPETRV